MAAPFKLLGEVAHKAVRAGAVPWVLRACSGRVKKFSARPPRPTQRRKGTGASTERLTPAVLYCPQCHLLAFTPPNSLPERPACLTSPP